MQIKELVGLEKNINVNSDVNSLMSWMQTGGSERLNIQGYIQITHISSQT